MFFFGVSVSDYGIIGAVVVVVVFTVIQGLQSLGVYLPKWKKQIKENNNILTGNIKQKNIPEWQGKVTATHNSTEKLCKVHELDNLKTSDTPVWWCQCTLNKQTPQWQELSTFFTEHKTVFDDAMKRLEEIERSHEDAEKIQNLKDKELIALLNNLSKKLQ